MKFPKNHQGFKNVIFIGRTSVGKSSLINTLFKTKLATSKGRCTKDVVAVDTFNNNVRLFDCQGFDNKLDITKNPELIPKYLGQMDVIYYLYEDPE
jgi:GTP-binding protein EngB required for normal cell division